MSDPVAVDPPEDVLAAEHALGLFEGAERAAVERRRLADPAFAGEVEAWEVRLAALAEHIVPVAPPEQLWARLSESLDRDLARDGADRLVVFRLKRSVAMWRAAAGLAGGLAACLLLALAWPRPPVSPAPLLTARLSASTKGPAVFVALYDPARRAIVLTPAQIDVPAGRSPELWLIPPGGKPLALGVADFAGSVQLVSTQATEGLTAGALAVSNEPKGGSPTGQPTGPVIATGQLSRL